MFCFMQEIICVPFLHFSKFLFPCAGDSFPTEIQFNFRHLLPLFLPFFPPTATVAKVIDRFEDETTDEVLPVGNIRKRASASLLEADKRYSGKATSRKALQEELWGGALSEEGSGKRNLIFSPLFAGKPCCHHVAEHGKPQGPVTKSSSN